MGDDIETDIEVRIPITELHWLSENQNKRQ